MKMTTRALKFALVSTVLMLGYLLFMVLAVSSSELVCDLETEYPIQKGSKIVGCRPCHDCPKGFEPVILCGMVIDDNESVGYCRACTNGTFSPTKDQKPCRICQTPKCIEHEIVQKNCTDTFDASHCTGVCDNGFVMNNKRTKCDLYDTQKSSTMVKPQKNNKTTIQPVHNGTNQNQPQHESTTKSPVPTSNETSEKDVLPVVAIVAIIIGALLFVVVPIIAVCWYCNKICKRNPRAIICVNDSPSVSTTLLRIESGKLIMEEECKEDGVTVMNKPLCSETAFASSETPDDSNNVTNASASDTPFHGQVALDIQESMISAPLKSPAPAQPLMVNARPVPASDPSIPARQGAQDMVPLPRQRAQRIGSTGLIQNPVPDMTTFEKWPKEIYDKICKTFDNSVAPGRDSNALISHLHFTVEEAREFKNKEDKADAIISSWMMKRENNVDKFLVILNDMGMTDLSDFICKYCECSGYYINY